MSRTIAAAVMLVAAACGDGGETPSIDAPPSTIDAPPSPIDAAIDHTTALAATFGSDTRVLDRAYYGVNADATLHVEAYRGGDPGCPTMTSATPMYTLVLGTVNAPATTSAGTILDYVGDLLDGPLGAAASTVALVEGARGADFIALDAMLTFSAGAITGHLYATHCAALDE